MPSSAQRSYKLAEHRVAELLRAQGWSVKEQPEAGERADLVIQRGGQRFAVALKSLSESRPDRVLPMLSMAILQAKAAAEHAAGAMPMAILEVPEISEPLVRQVDRFIKQYANNVPAGLVSRSGGQYFTGAGLQRLNHLPDEIRNASARLPAQPVNLFSDLNQWMLKLLLADDLPEGLLNAPRKRYRSGAELAGAAQASAMSASRLLQQLRNEGHLDESATELKLVRREDLFRRWSAASMRPAPEMPCRFLIRAPVLHQLKKLLATHNEDACLGLFAAADALNVGHVSGVPPHVYVRKLPPAGSEAWRGLVPLPSEKPDLILRQAPFPQSTFRGALERDGMQVSDIIQVWMDVQHHPTRGQEQADLIYRKFLSPITHH